MQTMTVRQSVTFRAGIHDVYEALMDSNKHSEITGSRVNISRRVGDKFIVYDGDIEGENIDIIPDRKIVQSWRYSNWPEGHYSKVTFSFKENSGNTRLFFTQTGVPEEFYLDIGQGWRDYYWEPMKEMLKKRCSLIINNETYRYRPLHEYAIILS